MKRSSLLSSSWDKIADAAVLEASVVTMNGLVQSGWHRTGLEIRACLRALNAVS